MELNDLKFMLYVVFLVVVGQTVVRGENATVAVHSTAAGSTPPPNSSVKPGHTTPSQTTKKESHSSTPSRPTVSTPSADEICSQNNGSCQDCLGVAGAKCLWCNSDNSCQAYPLSKVLPPKDMCSLDKARWGVCWLNFEALIIGVSTVGGIIILTITCCCVYCCCCRKGRRKYEKEDARYNAQKMERKAKSDERRSERKERLDEIRRKYGLMKDEPYQRFDS